MIINPILKTDSYKISHWWQFPPKTTNTFVYFIARGGLYPEIIPFGMQATLVEHFAIPVHYYHIDEAEQYLTDHFGSNQVLYKEGWKKLIDKHGGYYPLSIKFIPEATPLPTGNVFGTIENTDPEFYWLTTNRETILDQLWYPSTVATISYNGKKIIKRWLEKNGTPEQIDYKLHDFGFRGSTSIDAAAIGGLAHLLSFKGTDTLPALQAGRDYYMSRNIGHSIPAMEHATVCAWLKAGEADAFKNMMDKSPTPLIACVSDSYDIFSACSDLWGGVLKDAVLLREGTVVIRPDSGKLPDTLIEVINRLNNCFGSERIKGEYRVLNPHVRLIQGDGVSLTKIDEIYKAYDADGWSADNLAFGMGKNLLQACDRDTLGIVGKLSEITVDGEVRDVYKDPVTDSFKKSLAGRLKLIKVDGPNGKQYKTVKTSISYERDELVEVYRNGQILKHWTFDQCREHIGR